jgi:L-threonylcarbamoyladenylate synthase
MTHDSINTLVLHVDPHNLEEICQRAGLTIQRGGLVAFPTETVYGLGADALNPLAVNKIFKAKGRPSDNPLIVHVSDTEDVERIAEHIPKIAYKLMDAFWPGPLTLVLPRKDIVPDVTTSGLDTVAVRMPNHPVALMLIKKAGVPIAAPSANTSGKPSPTAAQHVIDDLAGQIDMIIDAGKVEVGVESTILDVTTTPPTLLRPGGIGVEKLERIVGTIKISTHKIDTPRAPGMKYTHYAPEAKVILVTGGKIQETIHALAEEYQNTGAKVGLLLCEETDAAFGDEKHKIILGKREDATTLAKNLFHALRAFDKQHVDIILADGSFSKKGLGLAVMNRLKKAASEVIRCGEGE